ncbi:MAG: hypothetical protein GWN01_12455, partial [Nitrosopumilaceae archaeon]|nr:hypothetical protein [Nitrosopumilaceae archaeon]NIX62287.1 hypothetical protein [Nitrosopumilaceae archaeon]
DFIRERNSIKELLAVAIRKDLFSFFQQVGQEAHFSLQRISLNCFSIDELYRRFFPNLIGQSLLVNFTERGFEMVVSDEQNFLDFNFKPYTPFLQDIEQLSENEVFSAFSAGVDEIQKPGVAESSMYSISQIFLFGTYFKSH